MGVVTVSPSRTHTVLVYMMGGESPTHYTRHHVCKEDTPTLTHAHRTYCVGGAQPTPTQDVTGYIPSLTSASPTHLLIITATMMGTMYVSPPVSSNMITTRDTGEGRSKVKYYLGTIFINPVVSTDTLYAHTCHPGDSPEGSSCSNHSV